MEEKEGKGKYYSEKDADLILKKAVEIQHHSVEKENPAQGLASEDLASIAQDLGVGREALKQAMDMVDMNREVFLDKKAVRDLKFSLNVQADQKKLKKICQQINLIVGDRGEGIVGADSLIWQSDRISSMSGGSFLNIEIFSDEEGTQVHIKDDSRILAGGLYGGIGGGLGLGMGLGVGLGVGIGALGSVLFSLLFPLGALVGSLGLSRFIFGKVLKDRNKKIGELVALIKDYLNKNHLNNE